METKTKKSKIKEELAAMIEKIGQNYDPEKVEDYVEQILGLFEKEPNLDDIKKGLKLKEGEEKK